MVMMDWFMYCSSNEVSMIEVSLDIHHKLQMGVNFNSLWISNLRFAQPRMERGPEALLSEGLYKGKSNQYAKESKIDIDYWPNDTGSFSIEGDIYLNVLGDMAVAPVYGAGGSEHVYKSKKFDFEA